MLTAITGSINLMAVYGNVFIKRSGKVILVIPDEQISLGKEGEERPKLQDGDVISVGQRSLLQISSTYDIGKTSKTDITKDIMLFMLPGSEVQVVKTEEWDKTDKEKDVRCLGTAIIKVELLKGIFNICSRFNEVETPTAIIKPMGIEKPVRIIGQEGSGEMACIIEITQDGTTYVLNTTAKKTEFINKNTGRSVKREPKFIEEMIITRDSIYRKPVSQIDERMSLLNGLVMELAKMPTAMAYGKKGTEDMAEKMVESMKTFGPRTEQMQMAFNIWKSMSSSDAAKYGITPEQVKEMQKAMEMMEKEGFMEHMAKAAKDIEKLGKEHGIAKFGAQMKIMQDKQKEFLKMDMPELFKKLETLPKYLPIESKFRVA
jgi:hypothetical protein